MTSDPAAQSVGAVEIDRGRVAVVGGSRIGITDIHAARPPMPGAMPTATTQLVVSSEILGVHVETSWSLCEGMLLPLADGLHRVSRISTPVTSDRRGKVTIDHALAAPSTTDAIFVGDGGKLRVGGPEVDSAFDLRILGFVPDPQSPQTAEVEWLPAAYARADTPAHQIRQQALKAGDQFQIGQVRFVVKAFEGARAEHPAWIELTMQPPR